MSLSAIVLTLLLQQVSSFADFTRVSGNTAKARYDNAVAEGRRGSSDTFWVAYQMPVRGNVRVNSADGIEIVQKNDSDRAAIFLLVNKADGVVGRMRVVHLGEDIRVYDRKVYWLGELDGEENGALLLNVARSSSSAQVRKDAVFWLGQEISRQAGEELEKLATSDPEIEVQKQVVFALSQRRNDESILSLQRIAKDHPNAAVRKQAIFWLGQKKDPRVLDFFEQLLKK
jgi:HEAT repeat protein